MQISDQKAEQAQDVKVPASEPATGTIAGGESTTLDVQAVPDQRGTSVAQGVPPTAGAAASKSSDSSTTAQQAIRTTSGSQPMLPDFNWGWLPIVISAFALIVSISNFLYSRSKDVRARAQSIDDDYWLRRIVSPFSIEPFLKDIGEIAASLPSGEGLNKRQVEKQWVKCTKKLETYHDKFSMLALLDRDLASNVSTKLEVISDAYTAYMGAVINSFKSGSVQFPDIQNARSEINAEVISLLLLIRNQQQKLGKTSNFRQFL